MAKEDASILKDAFDGLYNLELERREKKKDDHASRVRATLLGIQNDEERRRRKDELVLIAQNERSWPVSANQVIIIIVIHIIYSHCSLK